MTSISTTINIIDGESIDNFIPIIDANASFSFEPYLVSVRGRDLKGVFKHNSPDTPIVSKAVFNLHKCRCCTTRFKELFKMSGKNGAITLPDSVMTVVGNDSKKKNYDEIHKASHAAGRHGILDFEFLRDPYLSNFRPMEGGFNHFHVNVPEESRCDPSFTPKEYELFKAAITRYIIQGQMCRLVLRLVVQGLGSVLILETCLGKVDYGTHFLLAARWAKALLEDLATRPKYLEHMTQKGRFVFFMKHLLNGTLAPDLSSGAVCYELQTLAQLVDLLEVAKDEKAMMAICQERLSPSKYQRPTAPASAGQVGVAIKLLGDFTISVAKISDRPDAIPVGVKPIKDTESSAMDGFAAQLSSAITKVKKSSFADRCGVEGTMISKINAIKTVEELVDFVTKHPEVKIKINTSGQSPMYLAETTLPQDRLCVPFMWSMLNAYNPKHCNMDEWCEVTHIIPTWKLLSGTGYKNVLFVVKKAKLPTGTYVCTFPSFLSSEYSRTCRTAFEGLKNTMKLIIPSGEPLAVGIGNNTKDEHDNLYGSGLNLMIGEVNVVIRKLK